MEDNKNKKIEVHVIIDNEWEDRNERLVFKALMFKVAETNCETCVLKNACPGKLLRMTDIASCAVTHMAFAERLSLTKECLEGDKKEVLKHFQTKIPEFEEVFKAFEELYKKLKS